MLHTRQSTLRNIGLVYLFHSSSRTHSLLQEKNNNNKKKVKGFIEFKNTFYNERVIPLLTFSLQHKKISSLKNMLQQAKFPSFKGSVMTYPD